MKKRTLFILCSLIGSVCGLGFGPAGQAVQKVREGVKLFRAKDYPAALKIFSDADVTRPDDSVITFDRGCAYAVTGDSQKATDLFQKTALSRDTQIAVQSRYNLGCLAAAQARAAFGKNPVDATAEQRQQGLSRLASAVAHYRDCLRLDNEHADARYNIETIRLWIKQMQALWDEHDRQKTRQEMSLLQFVQMLQERQREVRRVTKTLVAEPDSPKRRQETKTAEISEHKLVEEIPPLKEKIKAKLHPQQPTGGNPPSASPGPSTSSTTVDTDKVQTVLLNLANEAGKAMQTAEEQIANGSMDKAVMSQRESLDRLNDLFMAVAPFANLVSQSVQTQQTLVEQSKAVAPAQDQSATDSNGRESVLSQSRVAEWSGILPLKAKTQLKQLEALESAAAQKTPPNNAPAAGGAVNEHQQVDALKAAMHKAVELAPQAQTLAQAATNLLVEKNVSEALPKQQDALKLLKEIAEALPKQQQQNQQPQQKQQPQQGEQQKQQPQNDNQNQQKKKQHGDFSQRQAEATLRKVRERAQQHREMERQLQRFLARPENVDRDW